MLKCISGVMGDWDKVSPMAWHPRTTKVETNIEINGDENHAERNANGTHMNDRGEE
jgi:hypothetical protein